MNLNDELSRRFFLSSACAGGIGLAAAGRAEGSPVNVDEESLLRPTPADALVDFMEISQNIEGGILKKYYHVIGNISKELNQKYLRLKEAIADFRELVPELNRNNDLSRIQNGTEIGNLAALSLVDIAASGNLLGVGSQSKVMAVAGSDVKRVGKQLATANESITLSPRAVEKLREILDMIENLRKPTGGLKDVSELLFSTSSELRKITGQIRPLIIESVRLLVAADLLQTKVSPESVASVKDEMTKEGFPTSVVELRKATILNLKDIERIISSIDDFAIPERLKEFENPQSEEAERDMLKTADLIELLAGTKKWIESGIGDDQSSNRMGNGKASFVKAGFSNQDPPWWAWNPRLWKNIWTVLQNDIPVANFGRVRTLYIRKVALNFATSSRRQEAILYNLIVALSPVSKFDLRSRGNLEKREVVARKLSRL